jgi:hypothetical protein
MEEREKTECHVGNESLKYELNGRFRCLNELFNKNSPENFSFSRLKIIFCRASKNYSMKLIKLSESENRL